MKKFRFAGAVAGLLLFTNSVSTLAQEPEFPWLSVAPELGYQFFSAAKLEKDFDTEVGPRNGVTVKIHADVGGDKWGLEIAPLYAWQGSGDLAGNLSALGGEITLAYRFSFRGGVYPGIGIGFHGAYLLPNENIQKGCELAARIPLGATWYFLKYLGLVVEGGFMMGAVGIRFKDGTDAVLYALSQKTQYAFTLGFDLMVGLRFP